MQAGRSGMYALVMDRMLLTNEYFSIVSCWSASIAQKLVIVPAVCSEVKLENYQYGLHSCHFSTSILVAGDHLVPRQPFRRVLSVVRTLKRLIDSHSVPDTHSVSVIRKCVIHEPQLSKCMRNSVPVRALCTHSVGLQKTSQTVPGRCCTAVIQ